ncbi:MAG: ribosome-associated translation inhibitor RaiA [Deltaproteobacteria bacterium]|nr:ribosome-associated translation inhibitor RaiA [Deltaproteobacteria bacterium]
MQVHVTFRHLDSSDALRKYAVLKSDRLAKYLFEPIEIHWVLSVEGRVLKKIRHLAEATIAANGVKINAQGDTQDMYSAIDMAIDKLDKQVRRHKEKVKEHKPHNPEASPAVRYGENAAEPGRGAASGGPRIIKKENQFVKPMSVEEAVMQMDALKNDFLVFTDSATGNISVIYRTKGPDYGLIEAEVGSRK